MDRYKREIFFVNLCPGTYHLIIQHIGCPIKQMAFELYADTIMEINIEHHVNMLHEVDVHEHHDNAMNEHALGINSIDNNSQKSLAASLTHVPGVNIISKWFRYRCSHDTWSYGKSNDRNQ